MADSVGGRIHAVRHDGAITEHVIGLPIIKRGGTGLIVSCMGIADCNVAEEGDGRNCVVSVVHPDAVVNACGTVLLSGGLVHDRCGTHTEVIVFIPIGHWAGTNVGISGFVLTTKHSLAEAGLAVAEVTRQAAVAHS